MTVLVLCSTFATAVPAQAQTFTLPPTWGKVGATNRILGTDLTGVTGVTFNGTAALAFKGVSGFEITAKVPEGATSGVVEVVTVGGTTLTSNTVVQMP
jgi:hypothetical protein